MPNLTREIRYTHPSPGVVVATEHIEWTPERPKDTSSRLPSTWRQPIGKKLTDAAIMRRAEEGWYGQEWKNRALAARKLRSVTRSGLVIRCVECKREECVRYLRFSYLPKAGYYCPLCQAKHRDEANRDSEQRKKWKELMMKEYE